MQYFRLCTILLSALTCAACGPMAAVGAIGTTITNAAYHAEERKLRNSSDSPAQRSASVAIANLNLGVAYMQQGQYEKALEKLNRARLAKPDYAPTYNVLGLLHQKLGEVELAESNFKQAIKLDPGDSSILNNYGFLLCQQQRYEEADTAFMRAANDPLYDSPEIALTNAGTCALANDRSDDAENYFRQALEKNVSVPQALIQMAELSYEQGNYLAARGYLQRYLGVMKHNPRSLWLGIRIEQELGNNDAVSSYVLLLRNNYPDTKEAEFLRQAEVNL